jgi:hypothetical protein
MRPKAWNGSQESVGDAADSAASKPNVAASDHPPQ